MPTCTQRLSLERPTREDVSSLHEIYGDPAVWTHAPDQRHTSFERTLQMVEVWVAHWERDGLGPWVVREPGESKILGSGGCAVSRDA